MMYLSPTMDLVAGWIFAWLGTSAMMVWNVPAIILEAALLSWLLQLPGKQALKDAFIMNVATTAFGAFGFFVISLFNYEPMGLYVWISQRVGMDQYYDIGRNFTIYFAVLYAISLVLSALVEGWVLVNLEPKISKSRLWLTSLVVNAFSYAICPFIFGVLIPGWWAGM
jgi:hypothetical protein